jgi:hypothetical protein
MNSLRTDDILGAKPRVRHMPKNLIRERAIPTSFVTNLSMNNPEFDPASISHSHYAPELPELPVHYQNNDASSYPFYARNRLTKESRYVNYDLPKEERKYQNESLPVSFNQSVELNRAPSEHRYQSSSKLEERIKEDLGRKDYSREGEEGRKASSRKSVEKQEREESKRIFRGLGFNIITNHKYEYTFEHKLPSNF